MNYSMMELVWLLLIYSFLGWVVETIVGTVKKKKFVNRGFSTGPFCLVYGIAAVFMAVTMEELMAEPVFQLIGCGVLATIIEWMAGKILERLNQHKWWDYSNKKWNFDGYICLQYSVLWAVLGFVAVRYGDAFFLIVYHMIPTLIREILLWILLAGMALDISASLAAVFHIRKEMPTAIRWNKKVAVWTQKFALMIVGHVEKRMAKAYPVIMEKTLKNLLSEDEYAAARASTLNAHYTSPTVIRSIYDAVGQMGFETGNILEPAFLKISAV